MDCSQETAARIDAAVKALLDRVYGETVTLLTENRALLDEVSEYLLAKETITGDELMAYVNANKEPETEE